MLSVMFMCYTSKTKTFQVVISRFTESSLSRSMNQKTSVLIILLTCTEHRVEEFDVSFCKDGVTSVVLSCSVFNAC